MAVTISGSTPTFSVANGYAGGVLTNGTVQGSVSGTSIDFTNIPTWVKRITLMLDRVSINGSSQVQFQLGTGGVATTSGYITGRSLVTTSNNETRGSVNNSTGFILFGDGASDLRTGAITFTLMTGNTWMGMGIVMTTGSNNGIGHLTGLAPLSGTLNMVRVTTVNGTDAFDNGNINILYE
jgi:hypothetical protein